MSPVIPAPEPLPTRRGRPGLNYSSTEMRNFLGTDEKPLGYSTLMRWAEQDKIPSAKIGCRVIFPKNKVNPFLRSKGIIE